MDPSSFHPREFAPPGRGQVVEGIRSTMARPDLRTPLVATFVLSTLSQNFRLTLPLMASEVFGRGVGGYGLLMSALGVGALFGALLCANLARPSSRMAGVAALGFGLLLLLAALAPTYLVLVAVVVAMGVGSTAFNATSHTLLLLRSDVDKRGRVMAVRELFSNGLTPLGSLGIGWVCATTSPRVGLAVGGVAAVGAAMLMFREPPPVRSGALVPDASG
jgi:MFS family permease